MISKFHYNRNYLKGFRIITTTATDNYLPDYFGYKKFDENSEAGIYSIFLDNRLLLLGDHISIDWNEKCIDAQIDYSISFDTQAISYFDRMLRHKEYPPIFKTIFDYIIENNLNIDGIPYLIKNSSKIANSNIRKSMFDTLRSFQIFRSLDRQHYLKYGEIKSVLSDTENQFEVSKLIEGCININNNAHDVLTHYYYVFASLAYITDIYISRNYSPERKLEEFLYYCQDRFHNLPLRMVYVAQSFFNNKNSLRFFKKIQKGMDRIILLTELENMAWDLYHFSSLENTNWFYTQDPRAFIFKLFLTFDKGLIELINLKPLKGLAYTSAEVFPFYARNDGLLEKFAYLFANEARAERSEETIRAESLPSFLHEIKESFLNESLLRFK